VTTLIICQRISDRWDCNSESTPAHTGHFVAWLTELGGAVSTRWTAVTVVWEAPHTFASVGRQYNSMCFI